MCLYPKLIDNKRYKPTKKNNYNPPPAPADQRLLYVAVGCSRCIECRKQKARNWSVRLQEELRHDKSGKFVTLSFSNEKLNEIHNKLKTNANGYQLDNNFGQNFGFQLSIPIFNGNQSKAAYQQSKLNYQSASLQQENAQRKLKQDIYAAYTNAVVAYNKLNANQKAVLTAEKAYSFATKRYELGLLGTIELLNNQNNFLKAKVNYKAAQYEYVFRIKLLEFYKGEALSL